MPRLSVRDWFVSIAHDARFAVRQYRRSPAFVAAVVLTLALGIGATTAIFTVVNGVLLRPRPYPAPERIVQLWQLDAADNRTQFSDPNFDDVREGARSFAGLAEFTSGGPTSVAGAVAPTRATIALVTHDFFDVLCVKPALGRTLSSDDERESRAQVMQQCLAEWAILTLFGVRDGQQWLIRFARSCNTLALITAVLDRVNRDFPVEPVRTLDALHLATLKMWDETVGPVSVLSTDNRVRANAAAWGLTLVPA